MLAMAVVGKILNSTDRPHKGVGPLVPGVVLAIIWTAIPYLIGAVLRLFASVGVDPLGK
jgi:hypothetical protein